MWPTSNIAENCNYHIIVIPYNQEHKWGPDGINYDCHEDCTIEKTTNCCTINPETHRLTYSDDFKNVRELMNAKDREEVKKIIQEKKKKGFMKITHTDTNKKIVQRDLNDDEKDLVGRYQKNEDLIPKVNICTEKNMETCFTVRGKDLYIGKGML